MNRLWIQIGVLSLFTLIQTTNADIKDFRNPGETLAFSDYTLTGEGTSDDSGQQVVQAGDIDGDGLADILVGAPHNDDGGSKAGKTYLFLGSSIAASGYSSHILSEADVVFIGEDADDESGSSIASLGDIDGDGFGDIVIGAWQQDANNTDSGRAYVILGSTILSCGGSLDLRDADLIINGENYANYFGCSVAGAGDADGDGFDDILIGAYANDDGGHEAGKAYLFSGASVASGGTIDASDADYTFVGAQKDYYTGQAVAGAGDVDGDGLDDLLIGAYGYSSEKGRTYLILGKELVAGEMSLSSAKITFTGSSHGGRSGSHLAGNGDVDGDGLSDFIIGEPGTSAEKGAAFVVLGSTITNDTQTMSLNASDFFCLSGEANQNRAGYAADFAGDVNGNGLDDIIVGAYQNHENGTYAGQVYVVSDFNLLTSGGNLSLADADYQLIGEYTGDFAGISVAGLGDVNGDGYDDIIVGAYGASSVRGKSYLVWGSREPQELDYTSYFTTKTNEAHLGYSVSSAGDVDGDGLEDILLGAPGNSDSDTDSGCAALFLGSSLSDIWADATAFGSPVDTQLADYIFHGENIGDTFGRSVTCAGDVDGDGLSDILIGAPENDDGGSKVGKAYLFRGSSIVTSSSDIPASDADCIFIGENDGDEAGYRVAGAGDVDGDGQDDLLVTTPLYSNLSGSYFGKAYLILANSLFSSSSQRIWLSDADYQIQGMAQGDHFGYALADGGGDIDGDGLSDLLISSHFNSDRGIDTGISYVFLASNLLTSSGSLLTDNADFRIYGESDYDYSGSALDYTSDMDGDNQNELIIGAHIPWPYGSGKTYVVLTSTLLSSGGTLDLADANYTFEGVDENEFSGASVAGSGDIDGDGFSDILIGAPQNDGDTGMLYALLGSDLSPLSGTMELDEAPFTFPGELAEESCGYSIAFAGDVNGDGLDDILTGAPYSGTYDSGRVYLFLGGCIPTNTIYVDAIEGDDTACGGVSCPVATIAQGIELAWQLGIHQVVVRGGYYHENVVLTAGLSLEGEQKTIRSGRISHTLWPALMPATSDPAIQGANNTTVQGFRFYTTGVDLDHVRGMTLQNNQFYAPSNTPIKLEASSDNLIQNNMIYINDKQVDHALVLGGGSEDNEVINNTIHMSLPLMDRYASAIYLNSSGADNNTFLNNIIWITRSIGTPITSGFFFGFQAASSSVSGNTIRYNLLPPQNKNITVSSLLNLVGSRPYFWSPYPSTPANYTLRSTSPCRDAGNPKPGYNDTDGTRNDMGLYGGPHAWTNMPGF